MLLTIEEFTEVITEKVLPCPKCNGSGYLEQHRRIQGGMCFKCDGFGTSNKIITTKTEKVVEQVTEVHFMQDDETFEQMLERRQKEKEANTEMMKTDFWGWLEKQY